MLPSDFLIAIRSSCGPHRTTVNESSICLTNWHVISPQANELDLRMYIEAEDAGTVQSKSVIAEITGTEFSHAVCRCHRCGQSLVILVGLTYL